LIRPILWVLFRNLFQTGNFLHFAPVPFPQHHVHIQRSLSPLAGGFLATRRGFRADSSPRARRFSRLLKERSNAVLQVKQNQMPIRGIPGRSVNSQNPSRAWRCRTLGEYSRLSRQTSISQMEPWAESAPQIPSQVSFADISLSPLRDTHPGEIDPSTFLCAGSSGSPRKSPALDGSRSPPHRVLTAKRVRMRGPCSRVHAILVDWRLRGVYSRSKKARVVDG